MRIGLKSVLLAATLGVSALGVGSAFAMPVGSATPAVAVTSDGSATVQDVRWHGQRWHHRGWRHHGWRHHRRWR